MAGRSYERVPDDGVSPYEGDSSNSSGLPVATSIDDSQASRTAPAPPPPYPHQGQFEGKNLGVPPQPHRAAQAHAALDGGGAPPHAHATVYIGAPSVGPVRMQPGGQLQQRLPGLPAAPVAVRVVQSAGPGQMVIVAPVQAMGWGSSPENFLCGYCQQPGSTVPTSDPCSVIPICLSAACCVVGLWPCWWIPFCVPALRDVQHRCPNCHRVVAVVRPRLE